MGEKIKVLVADDTLIAREGWKRILETEESIEVIGEAITAQEVLQKVRELRPNVLLMDLKWFDDESAGQTAIAQIKQEFPEIKAIAVTAYANLVAGARKAGAEAVLPKGFSKLELVELIRTIHGLKSFPPPTEESQTVDELSSREIEILTLMAEGLKDKEIAKRLSISMSTAKKHAASIISKLRVANRAQAVAIGFEKGLLKRHKR